MESAVFWTPGRIPLDAFTIMGANVKVTQSPIGHFGTGLKYAVAVILRHGGTIRLFVDGTEYEFYLSNKDFRGTRLSTVRMRKRRTGLLKWGTSTQLPFTVQLGKDWSLWQAYRELESNTRDENGTTRIGDEYGQQYSNGTCIEVKCPGFTSSIEDEAVFFDGLAAGRKLLFSSPVFDIWDAPSRHLYYRGIRVYPLRYPGRLTYDFKNPHVQLTEDRTAANSWYMMYLIAGVIQREISDRGLLQRILNESKSRDVAPSFETMELSFNSDVGGSAEFVSVVSSLSATGALGRSGGIYERVYDANPVDKTTVELTDENWESLLELLDKVADGQALHHTDIATAAELAEYIKNAVA